MVRANILVADDDPLICDMLTQILDELGHNADRAGTAAETLRLAREKAYDVVLLDLRFPDCDDLSTLTSIREIAPSTDVIMVTAETDDLNIVREAARLGAFDYVPKPIREDDIKIRVTRVMEVRALSRSHEHAVAELATGREPRDIIGESEAIRAVVRKIKQLAPFDLPVLLVGETGTGKELVARALHYGGPRRKKPFVSVNCAALPGELTESELFGHEKGAFTGAHVARTGAFGEAEDGTVFLDEIGDMNLPAQASLLHVLERGEYRSVGGGKKKTLARLITATNQNLATLVREGRFRKDLYYRINRMLVVLPPLRERGGDIPLLARRFLQLIEHKVGKGVEMIAPDALARLELYDWPGNVRELKNEIERAYIYAEGNTIRALDLSSDVLSGAANGASAPGSLQEVRQLLEALEASGGRIGRAAEMLGCHRNTVTRWMKKLGLRR